MPSLLRVVFLHKLYFGTTVEKQLEEKVCPVVDGK